MAVRSRDVARGAEAGVAGTAGVLFFMSEAGR